MDAERSAAVPPEDPRYEALRELFRRYELGELTDDAFTYLKRQILQGAIADEEMHPPRSRCS